MGKSVLISNPTSSPIDAVKSRSSQGRSQVPQPPRRPRPQRRSSGQPQQSTKPCTRCGKDPHSRDKCHVRESECHKCHRKGHYSSQCMSKTVAPLIAQTVFNDTAYLDAIGDSAQQDTWSVKNFIGSHEAMFKIDTGAEVTAISEKLYKSLRSPALQKPSKLLKGPGQHPIQVVGQFEEMLHHGQNPSQQQIFVIKDLKSNLFGLTSYNSSEPGSQIR